MEAIIHGFLLALGLILPLGVQNVFIFNQGATQRKLLSAFPAVITASVCDTLLILLSVFGISLLVITFAWVQLILFGVGFVFLSYMGWSIWKSKPSQTNIHQQSLSARKQVLFAASVSLLNPHAIIDIFGVIGTSSVMYSGGEKIWFTLSCVVVSWIWFAGLAVAGNWMGKFDTTGRLLILFNRGSSLIIWGAALFIGWKFIQMLGNQL